ncbi:MAG: ABC transporter ATP-binding protein [Bacteroidota bacterium]
MAYTAAHIIEQLTTQDSSDPNVYIPYLIDLADVLTEKLSDEVDMILLIIADWNSVKSLDAKASILVEVDERIAKLVEAIDSNALSQIIDKEAAQPNPIEKKLIFEGEGLGKKYPKSDFSLSEVDLFLKTGEITAVVGQNAHGKTTLLRMIAGELSHTQGKLRYNGLEEMGEKFQWNRIKQRIAYVPQQFDAWKGDLKKNLKYAAALHGIKSEKNEEAVQRIIQRFWLQDYHKLKWKQLSGGYKLRFELAKAMVWHPRLLIIDEPLAHLDVKAQEIVLTDLRNLTNSVSHPLSILISSQHLYEVEKIADNILFLDKGTVKYYGKVNQLGEDRKENTVELTLKTNLEDLQYALRDINYKNILQSGLDFTVYLPLEVEPKALLLCLIESEIEIINYRNISSSTKKLFN